MRAILRVAIVASVIFAALPMLGQMTQSAAQPQQGVTALPPRNAPPQLQPKTSKQVPVADAKPEQNQSPQSPKPEAFGTQFKKSVVFLAVNYLDGNQAGQIRGTGFFVLYEDKHLGENRGFLYLVTNRHVAEPHINDRIVQVLRTSIRLNLKAARAGSQSAEVELPIGPLVRWHYSTDKAVDLAVMPLAPSQDTFDYMPFPVSMFATRDVIESSNIAEGDSVLFTGIFYQFQGQKKVEPIVRQGILAMMPDEELITTLGRPGHVYFADAHVFGGNSGSPMFVNVGGFRGGNRIVTGFPYRLLGVVSGMVYETQDFKLQVATTLTGTASANSGISMVVPADELKALLDSPELQQMRDAEVARAARSNRVP